MIYITGDIHQDYDIWKFRGMEFQRDDIVIICGDYGWVWAVNNSDIIDEQYRHREFIKSLGCTVLWVDGNHCNFNRLKKYPKVPLFGGTAQKIEENCYHLMRGEVYNIHGKNFLAIGGAESHDKNRRIENISWWKDESITYKDLLKTVKAIKSNKIDYVISHCCPTSVRDEVFIRRHIPLSYGEGNSCNALETIYKELEQQGGNWEWFFGHYHVDVKLGRFNALFNYILPLTGA